jgi:hypothetical protein
MQHISEIEIRHYTHKNALPACIQEWLYHYLLLAEIQGLVFLVSKELGNSLAGVLRQNSEDGGNGLADRLAA